MKRAKSLADLLHALGIDDAAGFEDVMVVGITEDTRRLQPGDLFVAVSGRARNGADFIDEAVRRGAAAVVAKQTHDAPVPVFVVPEPRRALARLSATFFDAPTAELLTVGVTGTNGKTTVCHWIAHILGAAETELIGTVANEAHGLHALTTLPSPIVHRIARDALDAGKRNLVIEASSIGLAQHRLDDVGFDIAAFTNLSPDHLDWHKDMPAYEEAKAGLFRSLPPDGWAVVNADDPAAERMVRMSPGRAFRVSLGEAGALCAADIQQEPEGIRFRLVRGTEAMPTCLPATGRHNVENALVAAGVALCAGVSLGEVAAQLCSAPAVPGRGEFFRRSADGATAVVDFAHNAAGLARMLDTLRLSYGRIAVVLGCPGETSPSKRADMGSVSGRMADLVLLTSDNPKDEDPTVIAEDLAAGVRAAGGAYEICIDRAQAILRAATWTGANDVILIAGKGHETYQIVGSTFVPHVDAAVLEGVGFVRNV